MKSVPRQSIRSRKTAAWRRACPLPRRAAAESGRGGRWGAATLDYVLVMGAVLPMVALAYYYSVRIIRLVYEMTCALVSWPFM